MVSLVNDIRKNRAPLYYWSLGAGFITTVSFITFGYFYYSYRIRQRTIEGIKKGEIERIVSAEGLNSQELEKAIDLFQKQRIHEQIQVDNYERYKKLRNKRLSNEHVNRIVTSILNKRQRTVIEQQQTFIRRNTDENNKRNNYLVDKFTSKKRTILFSSSKENVMNPITKLISPKKNTPIEINDDDDDDFITIRKRPKVIHPPKINSVVKKNDPIKECLESVLIQIENNDVTCPICNQVLSNLSTIDQRQQHVNRCLEEPQIINNEPKHQKTLVSYTKSSSNIRKPTTITTTTLSHVRCQICGMSFHAKHTYLSHLKKCSNQNSVQLKHVVNFAAKTITNINDSKPITAVKKQIGNNIKNRVLKMEIPKTEDDEQQQLAIALSTSIKTALEPPNAFDILQAASKKTKTIDLLTTPLWSISMEDKLRLWSTRLSNLCERLITIVPSENSYKFPVSSLQVINQTNFGHVNWWNITTTDPHDDEMIMIDVNQDNDDDDNDRTETYTPPPLETTNDLNNSNEKENNCKDTKSIKQQSIIILDDSSDEETTTKPIDNELIDNYWNEWPQLDNGLNDAERSKLYSIPDIDVPPSPPREMILSPNKQTSTTTENNILDILTFSSTLSITNQTNDCKRKKSPTKRKKKKKPMSEYRAPSPFSPKPDYKAMDIEQLKTHATRYGLSTTQAKGRLIKILDEIYNFTHQYETDTDYEFDTNEIALPKSNSNKKDLSHTPPTPAIISDVKKPKQRKAIHQMSSSDEAEQHPSPPPPPSVKKSTPITIVENKNVSQSDEDDTDHEGRFLELTVYDLSSSITSSSSSSMIITSPTCPSNDGHLSDSQKPVNENCSQSNETKKLKQKKKPSTPILTSDSDTLSTKKVIKKPKLQTPTIPLKEIVRNYIESNPTLHGRILCYEPIDFEEFHKQIKTDLNLKIASKELMHCLDDQCITFTLRSRKGAFTSVMRAKRRHK
ncbi:unnamed protein product [Rotaria sp. Silwood1]|nr:unnamed protein product [Rotaria sp. Silwood1]